MDSPVEGGRQDGAENARLRAVIHQTDAQPYRSEPIPLGARNALDESPQPEPTQVAGHPSGTVVVGREPAERSHGLAEVSVAEAAGQQVEAQQGDKQRLHPRVAEAQSRGALAVEGGRAVQPVEHGGAEGAVVAEALDAEQASVSGRFSSEADLLQIIAVGPTHRAALQLDAVSVVEQAVADGVDLVGVPDRLVQFRAPRPKNVSSRSRASIHRWARSTAASAAALSLGFLGRAGTRTAP